MPVSLIFLGVVASNRRLMGRWAIGLSTQIALGVLAAGFFALAYVGLG